MKPYHKCRIIRVKSLDRPENTDQPSANLKDATATFLYELLFQTHESLNLAPGSQVRLHNSEHWFWVASEPTAPWTRLIIDAKNIEQYTWGQSIRISQTHCVYPNLIEDKNPAFYCSGTGIAIPLSYISTFPDRKPTIVYLGPGISLEFLQARTDLKRSREQIESGRKYYCKDGVIRDGCEIR